MVATDSVIEIEVGSAGNDQLYFRPLERRIRGTFNLQKVKEPKAMERSAEWPAPIPGQRIRVDLASGTGYVLEPLRLEEHQVMAEKVAKRRLGQLPPARETHEGINVPTWLYWMRRAVDAGLAKVSLGNLPAKIDGKISKRLSASPPDEARITTAEALDNLAKATAAQTELLGRLLEKLIDQR